LETQTAHLRTDSAAGGSLRYQKADVRWFLSVDKDDLPDSVKGVKSTFRSIAVDSEEIEFSDGFTDLHTTSYEEVVAGRGFRLDDVRFSVEVVSAFRTLTLTAAGDIHPFAHAKLKA
jgi:UDP-N-acetyl-2-amino-2-deoxyglucuronate dehydrogenase